MPNLKDIRRRICSVKSTQKITRAMKMVAAARLRRAQERIDQFRAYADLTSSILAEVSAGATAEDHPLLERREVNNRLILEITSDRGLCGAFNGNLNRMVEEAVKEGDPKPELALIGRKANDYFRVRDVTVREHYATVFDDPSYATAAGIASELARRVIDALSEYGVEQIHVLAYGTEVDFCEELGFHKVGGMVALEMDVTADVSVPAGSVG